jgi:hypothetical protein
MSLSTIAATRQKEMNASIALDATKTRAAGLELKLPEFLDCISLARPDRCWNVLLSASARLAVGLGLKGVLPYTGWAGSTDTPRRNSALEHKNRAPGTQYSVAGPPLPQCCGTRRQFHCSHCRLRLQRWDCSRIKLHISSDERLCNSCCSLSRTSSRLGPCSSRSSSSSATATTW